MIPSINSLDLGLGSSELVVDIKCMGEDVIAKDLVVIGAHEPKCHRCGFGNTAFTNKRPMNLYISDRVNGTKF